ncbi:HAD family hydrolase [Azotobacter bryophylli]|uniref:HAD family hydrolase n=1 Tax=Azotobacter bryophylli TaxID=1986537 RepID=A0ABV7APM7_9GAMM
MIEVTIPGFRKLQIEHVVCDYNGTLAVDGTLLPGVSELIRELASKIQVHVITADTFGVAASQLSGLPVELTIIPMSSQAEAKLDFVSKLGGDGVVAIGNGLNDRRMLSAAAVGIALIQREGAAASTLACADVVSTSIVDALDLLRHPKRLIATLRS